MVGLQDLHLHWYGLELSSDPRTPLLTTVLLWGGVKTDTGVCSGNTCSFPRSGGRGGQGVAPLNVCAPEV